MNAIGKLLRRQVFHVFGANGQTEIDEALLSRKVADASLAQRSLGLTKTGFGSGALALQVPKPGQGSLARVDLGKRLEEFRLGLTNVGGIDQGQDIAFFDRRAKGAGSHYLPDAPRHDSVKRCDALLLKGKFGARRHGLDHWLFEHRHHLDTHLVENGFGGKLNKAFELVARGVVFRPVLEAQRPLGPVQVCSDDLWLAAELGDIRMFQRTLMDAVNLAEGVLLWSGKLRRITFHAIRLRHTVGLAPVVFGWVL